MASATHTQHLFQHWLSSALFNTANASDYFQPLIEAINPIWSLTEIKAMVESVTTHSTDTTSITLRPNRRFKSFLAGQHVPLTCEINGRRKTRFFSISSTPAQWQTQGTITLTIKRQPQGEVTNWINDQLQVGNIVELGQAQGDFVLPEQSNYSLYIAGGSGITPIKAHLECLAEQGFPYPATLIYYAPTDQDHLFTEELNALQSQFSNFNLCFIATRQDEFDPASPTGHLSSTHFQQVQQTSNGNAITPEHLFVCGPEHLATASQKISASYFPQPPVFHQEFFGLQFKVDKSTSEQTHSVQLSKSGKTITCDNQTSLLEAAEQNGLKPNYGCRMGICYTCKCKKKSGVVRDLITGKESNADEEYIQLCVSTPVTPLIIEA